MACHEHSQSDEMPVWLREVATGGRDTKGFCGPRRDRIQDGWQRECRGHQDPALTYRDPDLGDDTGVRIAALFTTMPVRGANYNLGPLFGLATIRFSYSTPQSMRILFSVRV